MSSNVLTWDQDGLRTYETGVDHGILFRRTADGKDYEPGVAWNGLTGINETPSGAEATDIYADNMKYLSLMSAEDFGGTITAYTYPEQFAECNGQVQATKGVTVGQQDRRGFGTYYRTIKGNDSLGNAYGNIHHFVYNAKCSPSEMAYKTVNDSPEAIEMSWEFKTTPVALSTKVGGKELKATAIVKIDETLLDLSTSSTADSKNLKQLLDMVTGCDGGDSYTATADTAPKSYKVYYTQSGTEGSYVYTKFTGTEFEQGTVYYEHGEYISHLPSPDEIITIMKQTY